MSGDFNSKQHNNDKREPKENDLNRRSNHMFPRDSFVLIVKLDHQTTSKGSMQNLSPGKKGTKHKELGPKVVPKN